MAGMPIRAARWLPGSSVLRAVRAGVSKRLSLSQHHGRIVIVAGMISGLAGSIWKYNDGCVGRIEMKVFAVMLTLLSLSEITLSVLLGMWALESGSIRAEACSVILAVLAIYSSSYVLWRSGI